MAYRLGGDRSIHLSYSPVLIKIIAAVHRVSQEKMGHTPLSFSPTAI
jgi:hypothetical protein